MHTYKAHMVLPTVLFHLDGFMEKRKKKERQCNPLTCDAYLPISKITPC